MYHEVSWNEVLLERFIKYGNLSEEDAKLLNLRVRDTTKYVIAKELNISETTYDRHVRKLKKIYDNLVLKYPKLFPPREFSRHYRTEYKNFSGNIDISSPANEVKVNFDNLSFKSLEEIRQYVVKVVECAIDNEFGNLDKVHLTFKDISVDIDISPK